ncbi:MAG TPA: hypothetical protein VH479_06150 [Acidimicrobiales bacterium]|jgi:hypothetical protein
MRALGSLAVGLASAMWLAGCSPADVTWISLTHDGVLKVDNCGTFITRVEARDAATYRIVWAAHVRDDAVDEHGGDAPVQMGRVPGDHWVEDTPLVLDPRPAEWVLTIDTALGAHDTIRVADDDLAPGRAYRPGHGPETENHLVDHTCNAPYLGPQPYTLVLFGLACVAVGWWQGRRLLRRAAAREAGAAP